MAKNAPVDLAFRYIEPEQCLKDKAPIIFLHGLTMHKETWSGIPEATAHATKRKTYAIDARNHGDSPWTDTFDFECNVVDILNFMDKINAPTAILVGHSMGGLTAIKAALSEPQRIEKLVVEDMSVRHTPPEVLSLILKCLGIGMAALPRIPPGAEEDAAKAFLAEVIMKEFPPEMFKLTSSEQKMNSAKREMDLNIQIKKTADGNYEYIPNIPVIIEGLKNSSKLMLDFEGEFKGPSCFIYGVASPIQVGADKDYIKSFFPNASFVGIEKASHSVHHECQEEFQKALIDFLLEK